MSKNKVKWFSIASIWFGGIVSLPALLIGSTLINFLSLKDTIISGIAGYSIVLVFMCLISIKAVQYRFNTVEMTSRSFGSTGARVLVGFIIGISTITWFGVQTNIAGISFSQVLTKIFQWNIAAEYSSILLGIIMVLTAVFGFKYLKWLNYIALPGILILIIYALSVSLEGSALQIVWERKPPESMPLLKAIGIVLGLFSVGGVISSDYNRFAVTKKDAVIGSILGLLPAGVSFLAVGAILGVLQNTHDIVKIFAGLGYPILAMTILILVTWTSNAMNAYSGGLGLNSVFHLPDKKRPISTLIAGLIGTILAVAGILDKFIDIAILLTAMIPPIAGVIISDYWFLKHTETESHQKINWYGVISWMLGVAIMVFMENPIKNILGIIISGVAYYTLQKINRILIIK